MLLNVKEKLKRSPQPAARSSTGVMTLFADHQPDSFEIHSIAVD